MTGILQRGTATIHYVDGGGSGRPVVFTHGAGMDSESFAAQARAVQDAGYRGIRWDLRGHGASTLAAGTRFSAEDALADLGALVDELRLQHPILVGHSLGGNLSQAYVRAHPDRAGGLVAVGSTWNAGPLSAGERLGLRLAAPMLRLIPASRLPGLMADASAVTPEAIDSIRATFARMPKRVFLDVWRATASFVAPEAGYRTPIPLGLVVGDRDRTGNIRTAMPAWADADGVQLRVIPGAGHVVMADAADATSAAIVHIIRGWDAEGDG
ncbi:alpha/beta hydrolase [Microbacterium bovistercoris]|uniref:Alpha/beta hydrolase n=1 Tax=Microbacterium bovistercoris TaxID=2293570 RepID=A0A371NY92_9MICO|nr:alpha/beta hydrolase [Microbacterium bovistercoris]REJ08218.1 alpha/beta hydrolase [Microbacterium bovistercoris]